MSKTITYYNSGAIPLINASELPYDVVNLAFLSSSHDNPFNLILSGAIAATDSSFTGSTIEAIKAMQQKGQKVLISFGGGDMDFNAYRPLSEDTPRLADSLANFVKEHQLDGIDIDYEDTAAFTGNAGYDGAQFLISLTQELRKRLPSPDYIISHAPQPPYLEQGGPMAGYIEVVEQAGQDIDWLNVQFYNNPPWSANPDLIVSSYLNYTKLPNMSPEKIVAGFPVSMHDAGSGYMPARNIVNEVIVPIQNTSQLGGIMNWQFSSDQNGLWIETISQALK
ncbi:MULTISPECIES: glycosyl hydrolase family 18 protein [unclassified Pseudoalteromonas]|uniref:glycosyl hydrolase family 18 protein n=1 Tax=unclassified Pseudoalteromonas TaxID=194690 RepID=UPI0020975FCB|nr:glycosyl hydrolase family 18 protein [Pseudoalteromonas sp. XMcav2-N]MCO7189554.1 glycosyl hydrolase family 18 protein [Pseudoalteromonas sp. XMcav2-N]